MRLIESIIAAILGVLGSSAVGLLIARSIKNEVNDFESRIFGEKGYISQYAAQIGEFTKGNFMKSIQPASVNARLENTLKEKLSHDMVSQASPLAALALDQIFPEAYGYVAQHPELLPQILNWAQPFLQRLGQNQNNGGKLP